jgi:hypothetical protein
MRWRASPDEPPGLRYARAERQMDTAWQTATLAAGLTLVLVFWMTNLERPGIRIVSFLDPLLVLAAGYGVLRRSRLAATFLVVNLLSIAWAAVAIRSWFVALGSVPFAVVYLRGLHGAVTYHRLRRAARVT